MYLSDRQFVALAAGSLLLGALLVATPLVPAGYRFRVSAALGVAVLSYSASILVAEFYLARHGHGTEPSDLL